MFWESNPTHTVSGSGGCFAVGGEEVAEVGEGISKAGAGFAEGGEGVSVNGGALPDDARALLCLAMALRSFAGLFL